MKAQDLKIGSVIEIEVRFSAEKIEKVKTPITRVSEKFVWFKYMGLQRTGRNTIDKFPTLYKIISL